MSIRSTGALGSWEEAKPHAKARRQVVCDLQADGLGGVAAGQGQQGRAGGGWQDLEEFEADLADNLYKIWNRMSSGSYFPPPVRAVEIPKPHGGGVRMLGVPTIADRVAQTVWPCIWRNGRTIGFTRTPMAIGRANRPMGRWRYAGSGAGSTTG